MDILPKSCISVGAGKLLSFCLFRELESEGCISKLRMWNYFNSCFVSCAVLSLDKQINADLAAVS